MSDSIYGTTESKFANSESVLKTWKFTEEVANFHCLREVQEPTYNSTFVKEFILKSDYDSQREINRKLSDDLKKAVEYLKMYHRNPFPMETEVVYGSKIAAFIKEFNGGK